MIYLLGNYLREQLVDMLNQDWECNRVLTIFKISIMIHDMRQAVQQMDSEDLMCTNDPKWNQLTLLTKVNIAKRYRN